MKTWLTIIVLFILAIGAGAWLMARSQRPMGPVSAPDLQREMDVNGWPADNSFAWSFKLPEGDSKGYGLSLRVRAKSSNLPAGANLTIHSRTSAMPRSEADEEFGPGTMTMSAGRSGSGRVVVQLLDLSQIGAVSSKPGQDLRILANMTVEGATVNLPREQIILPAGTFAGHSWKHNSAWTNNELYLMSFYIQNDRKLTEYDVVLEKSEEEVSE